MGRVNTAWPLTRCAIAMRNEVDKSTGHDTLRAFLGAAHDAVPRSVAVSRTQHRHNERALKGVIGL
jgi:hypothetical protein